MTKTTKVAVVTGGFGQLGQAVVRRLLAEGWHAAVLDAAPLDAFKGERGTLALGSVDLSSSSAGRQAMDSVAQQLGRIDALVNVAGTFRWETVEAGSAETFDLLYNTNLRTAVVATQAAIPHLLKQTSSAVVNVGAGAANARAGTGMAAYTASKAGVAKFTESLADEFKDRGLRVNAVLPSIIDTPANRHDMPDADFSRWVAPDALADVIEFLLSDAARAVTGALLPVTGRV